MVSILLARSPPQLSRLMRLRWNGIAVGCYHNLAACLLPENDLRPGLCCCELVHSRLGALQRFAASIQNGAHLSELVKSNGGTMMTQTSAISYLKSISPLNC